MKRSVAPAFWRFPRKKKEFAVTAYPGPHPRSTSYPLAILVRDVLKLCKTYREARSVIREGRVVIDGVARRDPHFPVGLMDVVEIPSIGKVFRMLPSGNVELAPVEIPQSEKELKLCKVKTKTTIKGGRLQIGFHDGRSIILGSGANISPGDSCLIEVSGLKIIETLRLGKDALVLVVKGEKAGQLGKIEEMKAGSMTRPQSALLSLKTDKTEVPMPLIMVVGKEKPLLQIQEG